MRMLLTGAALALILSAGSAAADKYTLDEPVDDTRVYGVGMRVDVSGKVLTRGEDNKPLELPLTVSATLSYRERRLLGLGPAAESFRAVRQYEQAAVDIEVAEETTTTQLPEALKLMVTQGRSSGLELYSLGGLLSPQELELVTPPCDSLGFIALLPPAAVDVGEEWTPPVWVAQFLARLEATTASELKCKLHRVNESAAEITFVGKAKGAVQGTAAEVAFSGSVDFDLKLKCITGAELQQTEKREVGAVSPGLDVAAKLRVIRKPAQVPGRVIEPKVLDIAISAPPASALQLRFESPWNLGLLHSRDWHLFQQTDQVAIFRLLDQGLFVAQCNVSQIPSAKPGEHTSEKVFQSDIQQSLGSRLKALGADEKLSSADGYFIYRVTAEGAIGERKLTWIYYLIADPSGRQASVMFAVDTPLVEKLGQRDREFVQSLRFGAPRTTSLLSAPPTR
jgi:hypothetical protein